GMWSHVVATFGTNNAALYVNGVLSTNSTWTGARIANTGSLAIGPQGDPGLFDQIFFDDLRLYNRVVSTNEVAAMADSDGDGAADGWEIYWGFDPHNPNDGGQDADGDGLSNAQEMRAGTNPFDPDTDHDGMPDGWEVTYGFNPLTGFSPYMGSDRFAL